MTKYTVNVDLVIEAKNEAEAKKIGFEIMDEAEHDQLDDYYLHHVDLT